MSDDDAPASGVVLANPPPPPPPSRLQFSADVQLAIGQVLRSTDPLDAADFNATAYINQLFPNEQSLAGIDAVIAGMERDIAACDAHIRGVVRGQATTTAATATAATVAKEPEAGAQAGLLEADSAQPYADGHEALRAAQLVIGALCSQIGDIKRRAEHTEDTVRQITRDIKQLDCAKRNLTAAITTLNHLHMLVGGVESLGRLVERRQYAELVNPLQAITEVNEHFAPYVGRIAQIGELSGRVVGIHRQLAAQIVADFHEAFGATGSTLATTTTTKLGTAAKQPQLGVKLTATQLADACKVVSVLDERVRRDLLKWFIGLQLEEYAQLFHENQDIAWLDRIDKRYAWLKRHLLDFEDRHGRIFPADWEVSERIAVRFCVQTREQLAAQLAKRRAEVDVKLLLFAIAKTAAFELLLAKRFAGVTLLQQQHQHQADSVVTSAAADSRTSNNNLTNNNNNNNLNTPLTATRSTGDNNNPAGDETTTGRPSPFVDLIGVCFKPYLDIYTNSIDRSLAEILERFVVDARTHGHATTSTSTATPTALSSTISAGPASTVAGGGGDLAATAIDADSPVYPSCADLFVFYKKCMVQCAQLSCGQPLLDLTAIFKRYLREYANRLLDTQLLAMAASGGGSGSGSGGVFGGAAGVALGLASSAASGGGGGSAATFGSIASSAAAAATSTTKDHLQHLTTTAGHVLHNLLKENKLDSSHHNHHHQHNASTTSSSASGSAATSASAALDASIAGRYTRADLRRLCSVLATAEYCLDTVQQLEDKLREKISPALAGRVDLGDERDGFHRIIAQCIQLLVADVVAGCDVALAAMVRIQWQQVNSVGDQSPYVSQLGATLRHTVPHVRDNLAASRKYYTQFCLKFVNAFMPRFVAALYRCRPASAAIAASSSADQQQLAATGASLPPAAGEAAGGSGGGLALGSLANAAEGGGDGGGGDANGGGGQQQAQHNIMGCEQLLLDTHSIKTLLLDLPSIGSQVRRKAPASYTKVVLRGMAQPEAIVKLVMSSSHSATARQYAEQYVRMLPASSVLEFGRVLEMRGVTRRSDQAPLVDAYRRLMASQQQQQQQQQQHSMAAEIGGGSAEGGEARAEAAQAAAPQPVVATEMGHMRKLEALIKKRLPN